MERTWEELSEKYGREAAVENEIALDKGGSAAEPIKSWVFEWIIKELAEEGASDDRQQGVKAIFLKAYDEELDRLKRVRSETAKPSTHTYHVIEVGELAKLVDAVYGVGDVATVHARLRKNAYGNMCRELSNVKSGKREELLTADYILTGHLPHLCEPCDKYDNLDLEDVMGDLCHRGFIVPGNWMVVGD